MYAAQLPFWKLFSPISILEVLFPGFHIFLDLFPSFEGRPTPEACQERGHAPFLNFTVNLAESRI